MQGVRFAKLRIHVARHGSTWGSLGKTQYSYGAHDHDSVATRHEATRAETAEHVKATPYDTQ